VIDALRIVELLRCDGVRHESQSIAVGATALGVDGLSAEFVLGVLQAPDRVQPWRHHSNI
jgi:hypothetical protein